MGMLQANFKGLHVKNESNKKQEFFMLLDIKRHSTTRFIIKFQTN